MRVCQVTSKHTRYDQRIFKKVAVSLANHGFESYILCADNKQNEFNSNVHICSISRKKENKLNRLFYNAFGWRHFKMKCLLIDADLYQIHDPDLLKLCLFLKRKGKRVIFDSHENYENIVEKKWLPKFLRKPIQKIYLNLEKKVLSIIDGVITVTPFIEKRLKQINTNTIIICNFPILVKEKRHSFSNFDICFGGNYGSYNHQLFLDVLNSFSGKVIYNLVLNCNDKEKDILSQKPAWKYVKFKRGPVPYQELEEVYEKSSIGMVIMNYSINYNWKEGSLGVIKIFEIMSKGMPVICTDFDIWKNIMSKYKCGICVNPNSFAEIKAAISFFLENPKKLIEYGSNARRAVEEKFNWFSEEKKLVDFYNSILKNSNIDWS